MPFIFRAFQDLLLISFYAYLICYKIINYADLRNSDIAVNIHYSSKSIDDFETGIFEAMACGCIIVSEKLPLQTLIDLDMQDAIIEVESPKELREKLIYLKNNPNVLKQYKEKTLYKEKTPL